MPFPPEVAENLLVKAARCCCLCRTFKGQRIEVHHIEQEADGGPSTEENGIPLCFDCHAEVGHYNPSHPRGKKYRPTELKKLRDEWFKLVADGKVGVPNDDVELVKFYGQCLDRPAFQHPMSAERSIEDFDKAVEDTITAINTGCQRDRGGQVVAQSKGKFHLSNPAWRETMDTVVDMLVALRSRYDTGVRLGAIYLGDIHNGQRFFYFNDHELEEWFDSTRAEVIRLFNTVAQDAGLTPLTFPRDYRRHWRD